MPEVEVGFVGEGDGDAWDGLVEEVLVLLERRGKVVSFWVWLWWMWRGDEEEEL